MKTHALKILRVQQGFTQTELARIAGLTQGRISQLERGLRPNRRDIAKLTEALGIDAQIIQEKK